MDDNKQPEFTLEASARYIKLAHILMTRFYEHHGKSVDSQKSTKDVIMGLRKLNAGIANLIDMPEQNDEQKKEKEAAIAEFSYQGRASIPQFLGAALVLARTAQVDDKSLPDNSTGEDSKDPEKMQLTKANFEKLANGLAGSLEYWGKMHAKRPMARLDPSLSDKGDFTRVKGVMFDVARQITNLIYTPEAYPELRTEFPKYSDLHPRMMSSEKNIGDQLNPEKWDASEARKHSAIPNAIREVTRRYATGFNNEKPSSPRIGVGTIHDRIATAPNDGLPNH